MGRPKLGGAYSLVKQIGRRQGTMILLAQDADGEVCAVEVMAAVSDEHAALLDEWAGKLARLKDPGLPTILRFGQDGAAYFLAREYVRGVNLKTLASGPTLDARHAVRYIIDVCSALGEAHAHGIVHGDLRPHNLILSDEGQVKVIAFAMPSVTSGSFIRPDEAPEFWHHSSPEEAQEQPLGPASDVYSLGVVLYELVTGDVPFDGRTAQQVKAAHVSLEPPSPRRQNVNIALGLEAAILRALRKDPDERYESMAQFRWDLREELRHIQSPQIGEGGDEDAEWRVHAGRH